MTEKFIKEIIENGKHDFVENGKDDFGEINYTTKKYRYTIRAEIDEDANTPHWIYSLYRVMRPDYGKGWQYYMDYVEDVTEIMESYIGK